MENLSSGTNPISELSAYATTPTPGEGAINANAREQQVIDEVNSTVACAADINESALTASPALIRPTPRPLTTGWRLRMHEALEYVRSRPNTLSSDEILGMYEKNLGTMYAELPDDAVIEGIYEERQPIAPNEVWVENEQEFTELLKELHVEAGVISSEREIKELVRHEQDHWDASRALGLLAADLGVGIHSVDPYYVWLFARPREPSRPITKLGLAAAFVRPLVPSVPDMMYVTRRLGYTGGLDQVADLVREHNHQAAPGEFLSMPLSRVKRVSAYSIYAWEASNRA